MEKQNNITLKYEIGDLVRTGDKKNSFFKSDGKAWSFILYAYNEFIMIQNLLRINFFAILEVPAKVCFVPPVSIFSFIAIFYPNP